MVPVTDAGNSAASVYLKNGSHRTRILRNLIRQHDVGIRIVGSSNTVIEGNTFADNGQDIGSS